MNAPLLNAASAAFLSSRLVTFLSLFILLDSGNARD
jgi:hypothetical protein